MPRGAGQRRRQETVPEAEQQNTKIEEEE